MDHRKGTQHTQKIIAEMLEFLESSSEEENDLHQRRAQKSHKKVKKFRSVSKTVGDLEKDGSIAKELEKLQQQFQSNTKEIEEPQVRRLCDTLNCKTNLNIYTASGESESDFTNLDWQHKLENHCRRSYSNSYIQEIYKAIYQDTSGHPLSGSADYYQAAQNYAIYGKHFLEFPENIQVLLNNKSSYNSAGESSNLITNLHTKSNTATAATGCLPTATSAACYSQICNSVQTLARPILSTNPGNSTSYGIFLGNKVTYVAGTPPTSPLIYNQHSTTTTNFVSNSLANAALATSPTILYTNPMLTATTQQYLTQFLSTAALTTNSVQSSTVATNGNGVGVYERLIYAQMLQQQLYQTQQAAAVAAMFQHKQRVAVASAAVRHSGNAMRSSPQHSTAAQTTSNTNTNASGLNLNTCNRQARSASPSVLVGINSQSPIAVDAVETSKSAKGTSD